MATMGETTAPSSNYPATIDRQLTVDLLIGLGFTPAQVGLLERVTLTPHGVEAEFRRRGPEGLLTYGYSEFSTETVRIPFARPERR